MIESDRLISARSQADEERQDRAIRPRKLQDYIGQQALRQQMEIFIQAAVRRKEALDHVLIFGPTKWG
jgi:Holliday junction DNA helicase RuvB